MAPALPPVQPPAGFDVGGQGQGLHPVSNQITDAEQQQQQQFNNSVNIHERRPGLSVGSAGGSVGLSTTSISSNSIDGSDRLLRQQMRPSSSGILQQQQLSASSSSGLLNDEVSGRHNDCPSNTWAAGLSPGQDHASSRYATGLTGARSYHDNDNTRPAAAATNALRYPRPEDEDDDDQTWPLEQRQVRGTRPFSSHNSTNQQAASMTFRAREGGAGIMDDHIVTGGMGVSGLREGEGGTGEWERGGGSGENIETWRLGLRVGSELDVKDTVNKWCEAKVIGIDMEAEMVHITYIYWDSKVRL